MNIIAHRGYWIQHEEKNTSPAFLRALDSGFGIETDVREHSGQLVLSHDIANAQSMDFEKLISDHAGKAHQVTLALNIKEDGIGQSINDLLKKYQTTKYFLFDMSVPEMVFYRQLNLNYFTRQSDIEPTPVLYDDAAGVWLDKFYSDWDMLKAAYEHLQNGKKVALVSPELHGNDEKLFWEKIKIAKFTDDERLYVCTDYPQKIKDYLRM